MHSPESFKPGTYLVLEGGEGVGKSTQAMLLAARGNSALTRETGGTFIGSQIREILHSVQTSNLDYWAEVFLVAADRAQHIQEVVRPELLRNRSVVSDRNWLSTVAYQGYGRGLDIDEIIAITKIATRELFMPTRFFLLETSEETAQQRMSGREFDRFELAGIDFHKRVRAGYNALAEEYGAVRIDAERGVDEIQEAIWRKCGDLLLNNEER